MDIAGDEPEYVLCKRWREEVMELSRGQLATLTGFSASAIKDYERPDKTIDENVRQRYRLACAAVQYGIDFDWVEASMTISWPVKITTVRKRK